MNNKDSHIKQLLKRWISGDIKSQGEQRLDEAAQNDKFLREALAGLRSTTENDHEQNLHRLRKQLNVQKKTRVVYLTPLRIAASVVLLLTAGWFIWTGPSLNSDQNIAMSKEVAPSSDVDVVPSVPVTQTEGIEVEAPKGKVVISNEALPAPTPKRQSNPIEEEEIQIPPPPAPIIAEDNVPEKSSDLFSDFGAGSGSANGNTSAPPPSTIEKDTAPNDAERSADIGDEALAAKQATKESYARVLEQKENALPIPTQVNPMMSSNAGVPTAISGYRMIEGYVTDSEGYPLIGAMILEKGTENGVVCDLDGYFTIAIKEGNNTQLLCSYTGFELTNILLDEKTNYAITLSEGNVVLNEVVVTALGSSRKKTQVESMADKTESFMRAGVIVSPTIGYGAFKDYIRQNTPPGTRRGKVRLRFTVSANGRPFDISVIHSTNDQLNDLAIGLISSGSDWEIITSDESVEVEYLMRIR